MERPRLCEVLGKEVETPFRFDGTSGDLFKINGNGILLACYSSYGVWGIADGMDLCEMINNGIPRWTEDDVDSAKVIRRLIPKADKIGWNGRNKAVLAESNGVLGGLEDIVLLDLPPDFFPSLQPEETISLDDILKGDEKNAD